MSNMHQCYWHVVSLMALHCLKIFATQNVVDVANVDKLT